MGYFREEKKGSGLFFSTPIQGARGFGFRWYRCKAGGPFLADCLSGFPAFAENDGRNGCLPCTIVTLAGPFLFFVFQEWLGKEAQEVLSGSTM